MRRAALNLIGLTALAVGLMVPMKAEAIPAFARLYGYACSACHSAFPALNTFGEEFRLSGYRKYAGAEAVPKVPPVKIGDRLELPGIVPISLNLSAGYNFAGLKNTLGDGSKNVSTEASDEFKRDQSSFNLNEFEILAGAPIGRHLSFFLDDPMIETEMRQFFDPEVGPHGAKFKVEGPEIPELVFLGIHDIGVRDLLNVKAGAIELPTGFSAMHRRLSFFPYLVYEATALDVVSRIGIDDLISVPGVDEEGLEHNQFRLSTAQVGLELFGRATSALHGVSNLNVDYVVGVVNGNNINADNNKTKDPFGRLAVSYDVGDVNLKLGGFGYYSDNTLDSSTGINGAVPAYNFKSRLWRAGPDLSLTLNAPIYASLDAQVLFAEDGNPTGFGKKSKWWGGFVQANVKPIEPLILYVRYDWINSDRFDDTSVTINGVTGSIGPVDPRLWDVVAGAQYFLYENFKLIAEYRFGVKDLRPELATADQLKKTEENAVFAGFRLVF